MIFSFIAGNILLPTIKYNIKQGAPNDYYRCLDTKRYNLLWIFVIHYFLIIYFRNKNKNVTLLPISFVPVPLKSTHAIILRFKTKYLLYRMVYLFLHYLSFFH